MDFNKCIYNRRSCRYYKDKTVPMDLIGEILDAGTYAPSAGNLQNWTFIVVTDDDKREALAGQCLNQSWMNDAPVHIVICDNKEHVEKRYPKRGHIYSVQACAMVAQNMILKAQDVGLGSCLVGSFDEDAIQRLLKLPENIHPEMIITLGYADHFEKPAQRTKTHLNTYFNEYGNKGQDPTVFPLKKQGKNVKKESKKLLDTFKKLIKK